MGGVVVLVVGIVLESIFGSFILFRLVDWFFLDFPGLILLLVGRLAVELGLGTSSHGGLLIWVVSVLLGQFFRHVVISVVGLTLELGPLSGVDGHLLLGVGLDFVGHVLLSIGGFILEGLLGTPLTWVGIFSEVWINSHN